MNWPGLKANLSASKALNEILTVPVDVSVS